jgi:hypothetical protein
VKAGQTPGPKIVTGKGEIMPHYLVAIHLPDGYDGSLEGEAIVAGPTAATSAPFQFRNRRRLTVLELNTLFPASSATRKNIKLFVDSRPPVRPVSGDRPPRPVTFGAQRSPSSYIKVAALIRRPLNAQEEHHALHDDPVSETIRKRKTWLGTGPQSHGGNGQVNEQLQKAGVLLALDGLTPPSTMSARVTFKGGIVTDGPFPETKEVVGGYWIIQVKSREEALEWASRSPGSDNEMVVEVRRMFALTDFDPETQKEIQRKFGAAAAAEMGQ